ncbi:MAG: DUF4440 domain-containing protein [bacterium]
MLTTSMVSCGSSGNVSNRSGKLEIMNGDKLFCEYALKEGFFNAFKKFGADNIVKFGEGQNPTIGMNELVKTFEGKSGTKNLSWYPVNGEVAASGDLGYTWGNWKLTAKDSTYYGNYFTVWKKQKDGKWKVALDGGNSTPQP